MISGINLNKRSAAPLMRKNTMGISFAIAVGLLGLVYLYLFITNEIERVHSEKRKEYARVVGDLVDAKSHEMRQRFVGETEVMQFVYLILAGSGANQTLKEMCKEMSRKLEVKKRDNPYFRLWLLQVQMASAPALLLGNGERNFVWAIVTVGREWIQVEIRYLNVVNGDRAEQREIVDVAMGISAALAERKIDHTMVEAQGQPNLGMLTQLPIGD